MIEGRAQLLGDNVSGDQIIGGQYLGGGAPPEELAGNLFESCRPDLAQSLQPEDILVAGENFGCGSSREQILLVMKAAGIRCVVARSFSRNFYRGGVNLDILPIVCAPRVEEYDRLTVDVEAGIISVEGRGDYPFPAFPVQLAGLVRAGGLIPYYKAHGGQD